VLSDGGLYNRDATAFKATADRLDAAQAALKHAEDEWLALEMKRESIERG
jgi:ABC transport system ATP-binding/permease protein